MMAPEGQFRLDIDLGNADGVTGTPSIYVNGRKFPGELTVERLRDFLRGYARRPRAHSANTLTPAEASPTWAYASDCPAPKEPLNRCTREVEVDRRRPLVSPGKCPRARANVGDESSDGLMGRGQVWAFESARKIRKENAASSRKALTRTAPSY